MGSKARDYDLIVVGGGPAGSTLAGLVKKHAPRRRVLLLEKSAGPRHHIGESLLPGMVPVLKELGVFEKIDGAGFPRKIGANYLWGKGRRIWENDFNDSNVSEMLARHGGIPERLEYAWQVRRSRYDEILLSHAESLGVEVRRGFAAAGILEDADGRVRGVRGADGEELRAGHVADCSGQAGFLSRFRRIRDYNPDLENVACYAYFRGAPWKYRFSGHPDKTKIFVCSVGDGWFWYIPIDEGVVSVGLVCARETLKKSGLTPEQLFRKRLAACAEIAPLLEKAAMIEDFDGSGKSFFVQSDWSYLNVASAGPGWLAAGDAAVFVDPILSSGVTLAHLAAHRAAYTLLTAWEGDAGSETALWADYNLFCRESASQFLTLALFWYGKDRSASKWWARAQQLCRAWLPAGGDGHTAFITVSAGLTRHYERLLTAASLAQAEPVRPGDFPFYVSVLGRDPRLERTARRAVSDRARLKLRCGYRTEVVYAPAEKEARLRPVHRVRFLKHAESEALADALNPRRVVTKWHLELLRALDGRTYAQARESAKKAGVPEWWLGKPAAAFVQDLRIHGVVANRL